MQHAEAPQAGRRTTWSLPSFLRRKSTSLAKRSWPSICRRTGAALDYERAAQQPAAGSGGTLDGAGHPEAGYLDFVLFQNGSVPRLLEENNHFRVCRRCLLGHQCTPSSQALRGHLNDL